MKQKGNQLKNSKGKKLQEIFIFFTDLYIFTTIFYNKHVLYNKKKVKVILKKNLLFQQQISYCLKHNSLSHYTRPFMVWPCQESLFCQPTAHFAFCWKQHSGTFHWGTAAPHLLGWAQSPVSVSQHFLFLGHPNSLEVNTLP